MIACTRRGGVPNVGGISAASTTPSRPLVPAPTKTIRPPLRSACVMISMPCGDLLLFLVHRGDDLAVLVHHHIDDVADRSLVDCETGGVDLLRGERLPLRMGLHGRVRPPHPGARTANRVRYSWRCAAVNDQVTSRPLADASNGPAGRAASADATFMVPGHKRCPARPGGPPRTARNLRSRLRHRWPNGAFTSPDGRARSPGRRSTAWPRSRCGSSASSRRPSSARRVSCARS